ncbi:MAG: hypothetical protein KDB03_09815 [Planctomycetales bacterium]|nr:hypothetical protein [Planctomycetales bacterium]
MNVYRILRFSFAALVSLMANALGTTHFAKGDLIYEIVFDAASYTVTVGGTQSVDVLFRETRDGTSVANLAAGGGDGLYATGFILNYAAVVPGGSLGVSLNSFTLNDAVDRFDPTFTTSVNDVGAKIFQLNAAARNISDGIEVASFVDAGKDVYEIKIGTFTFQNNGPNGAITNLTLGPTSVPFENLLANSSEVSISHYGTAIVSSVPEPGSLACVL